MATAPSVTGLTVSARNRTSLSVKWNASKGATGYYVVVTDAATGTPAGQTDVGASSTSATVGGLTPGGNYNVDVYAEPEGGAKGTGAHASTSTTLPKSG
jgi:hypothetical protein